MPDKVIDIPGAGPVAFPDTMDDAAINAAAAKVYAAHNPAHPPADPKHSWADTATDLLPAAGGAVGGIVGGAGGTVFGAGFGGVPGAVEGATLGGAAGEAAKQLINRARGKAAPDSSLAAAEGIGKEGAIQGAMQAAGAGIGKGVQALGEGFAPRLMQSALKLTGKAKQGAVAAVKTASIPPVVQTMLDEGINVTHGGVQKLNAIIASSNDAVRDGLASLPSTAGVSPIKVASRLTDTARRFANQVNPQADLEAISDVGQNFLKAHAPNGIATPIQAVAAQDLKTGTYRALGDKAYGELKGATIEAEKSVARGLKEELASLAQQYGVDLTSPNLREGKALDALKAVAGRLSTEGNSNIGGLATALIGHPQVALAMMLDKNAAVKSMIANGLYQQASKAVGIAPQIIRGVVAAIVSSRDPETPQQD